MLLLEAFEYWQVMFIVYSNEPCLLKGGCVGSSPAGWHINTSVWVFKTKFKAQTVGINLVLMSRPMFHHSNKVPSNKM